MQTAEHLLLGKKLCELIPVKFPAGTLQQPFEEKTEGIIYKAAPVGTITLSVDQPPKGQEYFLAKSYGEVFTSASSTTVENT